MMQTIGHWKDIFKVLMDEISLVLQVLDARNPIGTHNTIIEDFIKEHDLNLEVILILNKIDMIPREIVDEWYKYFRKRNYRIFSTTAKFNGGIRKLEKFLKQLPMSKINNVLIVGYPNTGKSSLIEALSKHKKKIGISSKAGFTRALMKIYLSDHVFLIDSPGVIPFNENDEVDMALKSCMMADKLEDPLAVVESIFDLISREQLSDIYKIALDADEGIDALLEKVGKKYGMLAKGGVVNTDAVIKKIIRNWQSNKLKYYIVPPLDDELEQEAKDRNKESTVNIIGNEEKKSSIEKGMVPPSLNIKRKKKGDYLIIKPK